MAIQFPCGICDQPIEVDDEWAGKTVACPFCQGRINAPAESQLPTGEIPTASPSFAAAPAAYSATSGGYEATPPVARNNTIAIIAAALAGLMLIGLITMNRVTAAHIGEIQQIQTRMLELQQEGAGFYQASQSAWMEHLEETGGVMPTWLFAMSALMALSGMLWVGALVCGILGARWQPKRRYAVAALIVCGMTPVLFCCGGGL